MAGSNAGGNLNILVFEVGMLTTYPFSDEPLITPVTVQPLAVAPRSIRYTDTSRTLVTQTQGGAIRTVGGRGLLQCALAGTFGVDARGFGPFLGTGEVRFQRFWREIVRLSDAINRRRVNEAYRIASATPGLAGALAGFDPDRSSFYINFYDFWNDFAFQAHVTSFVPVREYRRSAAGLVDYQLALQEVGPLVGSSLSEAVIQPLLAALTTWDSVNEAIESYTLATALDSVFAALAVPVSELSDSLEAVSSQLGAAQQLMSEAGRADNTGISTFFGSSRRLAAAARDVADRLGLRRSGEPTWEGGQVNWSEPSASLELDLFDEAHALSEVEDAARWQDVAGRLYGMSSEDYEAFLSSGAEGGATPQPNVSGTITHEVTDFDTPASLEQIFGVTWDEIVRANAVLPDDALIAGTVLEMPRLRGRGSPTFEGLPTFGSHVGRSAWGVDLDLVMEADDDGAPLLVDEGDCLEQGMRFLLEVYSEQLLDLAQQVPDEIREAYLRRRLVTLYETDRRISGVAEIDIEQTSTGYEVAATVTAINGGELRTGG